MLYRRECNDAVHRGRRDPIEGTVCSDARYETLPGPIYIRGIAPEKWGNAPNQIKEEILRTDGKQGS